jgi:hypothetical protein
MAFVAPNEENLSRRITIIALVASAAAYLVLGLDYARFGQINLDEGWYLGAARLVYQGELPYRDFMFPHPPLLPYVYGLPQRICEPGLLVGRLTSLTLNLVTIVLGVRLCANLGGLLAVAVFVLVTLSTPLAMWTLTTTRTEPLTTPLLMVAAFLLVRIPTGAASCAAAATTAVLLAITRVSSLPVAFLILGLALRRHQARGLPVLLVLFPAFATAMVALSLLLADPMAAWFDIIDVRLTWPIQLHLVPTLSAGELLVEKARQLKELHTSFGFVPTVALALACGIVAARFRRGSPATGIVLCPRSLPLAALAIAYYVPNLLPRPIFAHYFVPAFPLLLAMMASCAGHHFRHGNAMHRAAIGIVVVGFLLLQTTTFIAERGRYTSRDDPDLTELRNAAAYLRGVVLPGKPTLVTMDTYLAVESGLGLKRGWEMSIFAFFPRFSRQEGDRFHVLTPEHVRESLDDQSVGAVALTDQDIGILVNHRFGPYRWFHRLSEGEIHDALPELRRYRVDRVFPAFGQFRDNLYVLLPSGN